MRADRGVSSIATTAMIAAIIAVAAVISIPMYLVPFTLATFAMYTATIAFGTRQTVTAVVVYILLGAVGLPVFSGLGSGIGHILGPTGGYILGYIPMVWIGGYFAERFAGNRYMYILGFVLGTAVLYAVGVLWIHIQLGSSIASLLSKTVYPFIAIDLVKLIFGIYAGENLKNLRKYF